MTAVPPDRLERARNLMMASLDGELSDDERVELERWIEDDPKIREEWQRLCKVKEVTATMSYREPPEEVWEHYWISVYNRMERSAGWVLISIGALVIAGYGMWPWVQYLLADSGLPWFMKVAIFAVVMGLIVLAVSVIREKLFTGRRDPYKEVQR